MQTARIIPYMRRNTADEYRRRRQEALNTLWAPFGMALLAILRWWGVEGGNE